MVSQISPIKDLQKEIDMAQPAIDYYQQEIADLENGFQEIEADEARLAADIEQQQENLAEAESDLAELENLDDSDFLDDFSDDPFNFDEYGLGYPDWSDGDFGYNDFADDFFADPETDGEDWMDDADDGEEDESDGDEDPEESEDDEEDENEEDAAEPDKDFTDSNNPANAGNQPDPSQNGISFVYQSVNGNPFLIVYDQNGNPIGTYAASSGKPGMTDPSISWEGPIPPGYYTIYPSEISQAGFFRNTDSWGQYRVPLHPNAGTNMLGRDPNSFFLHGGFLGHSGGCINIGDNEQYVFPLLMKQKGPISLEVK
jgi:hypothetical protein